MSKSKGCGRTDHPVLLFRLILALLLLEGISFGGEGFPFWRNLKK